MLNYQQPDARGHFGVYGGTFVAETLIHALDELKTAYDEARADPAFMAEFRTNWRILSAGPARSTTRSACRAANSAARRSTSSAKT